MSEIKVVTKFNKHFIEQHEEYNNGLNDIHQQITKRIINLREEGVRKALVSLGWTPPKEDDEAK